MGAGQTYQWATQYPNFMDLAIPFCGSAKTSLHNQAMLEGVKSALLAAKGTSSGGIAKPDLQSAGPGYVAFTEETKMNGLKALGRVYSGWGFSQAFYRERLYESVLGFKDIDDFMVNFWEAWACSKDPENMLVMANTWQAGDCSQQEPYNGDFKKAMEGIKARTLVLPAKTDLYFPPEDSELEVQAMRPGIGELKVFPTIWGHWAGGESHPLRRRTSAEGGRSGPEHRRRQVARRQPARALLEVLRTRVARGIWQVQCCLLVDNYAFPRLITPTTLKRSLKPLRSMTNTSSTLQSSEARASPASALLVSRKSEMLLVISSRSA